MMFVRTVAVINMEIFLSNGFLRNFACLLISAWLIDPRELIYEGKIFNLFFEAHSLPRATLSENCSLLGTDYVRQQISEHISTPNGGYCS